MSTTTSMNTTTSQNIFDLIQKVEKESCALFKDQKAIILKQMEAFIQSCIDDIPSRIQDEFDDWKRGNRTRLFNVPTSFEFPNKSWVGISEDDKHPIFEKFKKLGFIVVEFHNNYQQNMLDILIDKPEA